ncbi:hypothetical protein N7466_007522 [Penicillium verhagenii]|uniref:uncharacterized protein n=1 Tax=Penicillium verhagenii TaxID=1562060 RepID=UPI0025459CA6|nr:uncharacterized protein N7466_007522 [Penicillium verhagenii]KAJ5928566.1 hypothetical protein N7466_007522 [Penicillium verhagenii]
MAHESIPLPRRKSCEACKTAKRRCDLALPACSRCTRRDVTCVYPWQQAYETENLGKASHLIDSLGDLDINSNTNCQIQPGFDFCPQSASLPVMTGLVDSHPSYHTACSGVQAMLPGQGFDIDPNSELILPRARPPRPLPEIIASQLQFAIDILEMSPRMMVLENQTPWCHPKLYQNYMPRAMQDAFACCSLYMSKNEANATVIMALFEARIMELMSTPEPNTTFELLARVHALILYQVMRLFDGDIRSRATADALFTSLESSVMTLLSHLNIPLPSDSIEPMPLSIDAVTNFWYSWIIQESARRTVLLAFYFMQIYKVLQGTPNLQCDGKLGLHHSWYLSAHLWNAQSAFDFAVAWAEKPHFVVGNLDFTWVLATAQPEDLDTFGKMFLVTLLGIDKTRTWFHGRGAILS